MRKLVVLMVALTMLGVIIGCGGSNTNKAESSSADKATTDKVAAETPAPASTSKPPEPASLVFMVNSVDATFESTQEVLEDYQKQNPHIKIEFISGGKDYESLMKAKMAANDLPDLFATHGWSVDRYSEYLLPLNDQPWANQIEDTILPIISNEKGEIFVLPVNIDISGIIYNKDILKKLEIEVPQTWDELLAASEKIKNAGITPIAFFGKDDRTIAHALDKLATPFLISDPAHDFSAALQDGTFDWQNWTAVSAALLTLKDKEYLNKDALTADPINKPKMLAEEKVAFIFENNKIVTEAKALNPNLNLGMMPVPAVHSGDQPVLIGGEREAYGVWKGSKNQEAALQVLEFLARPENIKKIATASSSPAGLKGVEVDLGTLTEDIQKYTSLRTFPYFDRESLPSGMWSTLRTIGPAILSKQLTPEQTSTVMKTDYEKLRAQQQ